MHAPFNFQGIRLPNFQWSPNFTQRGVRHFRPPSQWRQPVPDFSNEFWCETCDRGFRTLDILEKHKQQHQKCNIDGCQFIAHPNVITKHIQMQHASGLYKKIAKLQDPEEIKKWREERKKKYPTKENVEKAAAAMKEKIDRGEKMGLNKDTNGKIFKAGFVEKKRPYENQKNQHFHNKFISKRKKIIPKNHEENQKKIPAVEETSKLKPFAGIQDLITDVEDNDKEFDCDFTIEDEDEVTETNNLVKVPSGTVCQALTSLLCNYGSSDEEVCDKVITPVSKNTTEKDNSLSQQNDTIKLNPPAKDENDDDDSGPEEVKVTKKNIIEPNDTQIKPLLHKKKQKIVNVRKPFFKRPKPKLPSTLLHKLLFKEMRQERNIILQCIRHIVKNNFFD